MDKQLVKVTEQRTRRRRKKVGPKRTVGPNTQRDRVELMLMQTSYVPRYLNFGPNPVERHYRHTCNFPDVTIMQNAASSYVLLELQINGLFDLYASAGGPKVTNFEAAALVYARYHPLLMGMRLDAANHEAFACDVGVIFRDRQPSLDITSWLSARQAFSVGVGFKPRLLGSTSSMNRTVFKIPETRRGSMLSLASLLGDPQEYISDANWTGVSTANPPQLLWIAVIVTSPSALTNLPNGVQIDLNLNWLARWFSLQNDQTHFATTPLLTYPLKSETVTSRGGVKPR